MKWIAKKNVSFSIYFLWAPNHWYDAPYGASFFCAIFHLL